VLSDVTLGGWVIAVLCNRIPARSLADENAKRSRFRGGRLGADTVFSATCAGFRLRQKVAETNSWDLVRQQHFRKPTKAGRCGRGKSTKQSQFPGAAPVIRRGLQRSRTNLFSCERSWNETNRVKGTVPAIPYHAVIAGLTQVTDPIGRMAGDPREGQNDAFDVELIDYH
jgi:hypothetical protein